MCEVIMAWKVLAFMNIALVAADVLVYPKSDPFILLADFYDQEANFGLDIPKRGISTGVVVASNEKGCDPILPPPKIPNPPNHWAVLIARNNCTFEDKVINAQNAFYDVAIVHNVDSNALEIMNASNPDRIHIMAIFISANTGKEIRTKYLYEHGFVVQIEPNTSSDFLSKILIPFIVVISASFILMVGFMVVKCIKDHRRARRRRMPHSTLNKIPTTKYRKNDPYETCAICLDDFIEGEKLRVLPCSHAYHSKCIDPWLTRNRRVCPMCKRKVFAADEHPESDGSSSADDDHTPLLRDRNASGSLDRSITIARRLHMRRVLDVIERERQARARERQAVQNTSHQSSSSGNSSSASSDASSHDSVFLQATQDFLNDLDEVFHHKDEDHHRRPDHPEEPDPHRDAGSSDPVDFGHSHSHSESEVVVHDQSSHDPHTDTTYDSHHEVAFHDNTPDVHDDSYDTHDHSYDTHDHSYDC